MADDSNNDPVLSKYASKGALAEAREQIEQLDRDARAKLNYELIDQHIQMAMKDGCTRKQAISFAMERFGVSERTVETAIAHISEDRPSPHPLDDGQHDF
jgi:hypothetical protein